MRIKLKVEDAHRDIYEQEFEVRSNREGFPILFCTLCNTEIIENSCANGHIAYTIIDKNKEEKMYDAIL